MATLDTRSRRRTIISDGLSGVSGVQMLANLETLRVSASEVLTSIMTKADLWPRRAATRSSRLTTATLAGLALRRLMLKSIGDHLRAVELGHGELADGSGRLVRALADGLTTTLGSGPRIDVRIRDVSTPAATSPRSLESRPR